MKRTLLIGLDGATFAVLDPLLEQGVMPFLKRFLADGVRAPLRTIIPALTPPAWTSLMTGRTPGHHGVFDFFRLESPTSHHIRFFTSHDVACDTIWGLASSAGKRVTALNFPSMFPAPRISGYVVPGWVPWRQLRLACWPEGLFDRIKSIPGFNARELAMDIKLEEKATEGCAENSEYGPWIEFHIRREQNWLEITRHLTAQDPSDFTAVLFDGVDKLQHLCWRFIRPEDDRPLEHDWEFHLRDLCLEYFRKMDGIIEQLCGMAGPDATVLIASDHGFGPTYDVFHVNTWLERHGYLAWSEAAAQRDTQGALLGVGQVAKHTWLLDWTRTRAFATTPTSNGIHITGVPEAEYHAFRDRLIAELRAEPVVSEIYTREQAFDGPAGAVAPDLTLVLRDGGLISILPSEATVLPRPVVSGAHRPVGVFAAKGPGVRRNFAARELSILDVAPAVLYSLDVPLPESLEGRLPEEIWEPAALRRRQPRRAAAATVAATTPVPAPVVMSAQDEQIVMERLRELGYIE